MLSQQNNDRDIEKKNKVYLTMQNNTFKIQHKVKKKKQ